MDLMLNYIFDLDGTIINSSNEVLVCFKKAFARAKYPLDERLLTSDVIGPPLKEIIKLLAPKLDDDEIINSIMEHFRAIYDYDEEDISFLYEGVYDFLLKLHKDKKNLFIATFKPHIPTMRIVKQFKLDMFRDVYTIDKMGYHQTKDEMILDILSRYNLKKEETVMIGDAASDVIAAKKAGVKSVGVLWGYGSDKSELISHSDLVVKNVKELECLSFQTI